MLGIAAWNRTEEHIWLRSLRTLVDQARREGAFAGVDTELAARVISASLTELVLAGRDRMAVTAEVLDAVLHGLAHRP